MISCIFVYVWLSDDGLNIVRHFSVGLQYFVYFLRRHVDCIRGNRIEKNLCTEETVHLYTTEKNRPSKQEKTTEKLTIARTSFIFIIKILFMPSDVTKKRNWDVNIILLMLCVLLSFLVVDIFNFEISCIRTSGAQKLGTLSSLDLELVLVGWKKSKRILKETTTYTRCWSERYKNPSMIHCNAAWRNRFAYSERIMKRSKKWVKQRKNSSRGYCQ